MRQFSYFACQGIAEYFSIFFAVTTLFPLLFKQKGKLFANLFFMVYEKTLADSSIQAIFLRCSCR